MSAGICIMNKEAVALAADSAATIGNRRAFRNSARKIYQLSGSVAVITYGSADYMNVPLEIILPMYARSLGDRTFPYLEEYVEDLRHFLSKNGDVFRFRKNEKDYVRKCVFEHLDVLDEEYEGNLRDEEERLERKLSEEESVALGRQSCEKLIKTFHKRYEKVKGWDFEEYLENKLEFSSIIADIVHEQQEEYKRLLWMDEKTVRLFTRFVRATLDTDYFSDREVGICIAGYGEQDIYPKLRHFMLDGWINGTPRYWERNTINIGEDDVEEERGSWIETLAQYDVMDTIFLGMDSRLLKPMRAIIQDKTEEMIGKINKRSLSEEKRELVLSSLTELPDKVVDELGDFQLHEYWFEFLSAVRTLGLEEMLSFAEAMINITSIRRNIIVDDNNGTVGGPVDVAVITKCGGFRWVKNKMELE